ncbi:hypothetical protein LguiB_018759 [Lonicera macranthoides]
MGFKHSCKDLSSTSRIECVPLSYVLDLKLWNAIPSDAFVKVTLIVKRPCVDKFFVTSWTKLREIEVETMQYSLTDRFCDLANSFIFSFRVLNMYCRECLNPFEEPECEAFDLFINDVLCVGEGIQCFILFF